MSGNNRDRWHPNLRVAVNLWPTPTVTGNTNAKGASKDSGDGLATAVRRWPTPTRNDGRGGLATVGDLMQAMWAGDNPSRPAHTAGQEGLNPAWVEALMGFPVGWTEVPDGLDSPQRRTRSPTPGSRRGRRRTSPTEDRG